MIANDISRCYGKHCDIKDSCQRHLQIALDAARNQPHHMSFPYTVSLREPDAEACRFYLEREP